MAEFETSVDVSCSIERAFDFLLRPANVVRISPPSVGLKMLSAPEVVEKGSQIQFQIQAFGQIQSFIHHITAVDPVTLIREEQLQGLFKSWIHEHVFETVGPRTRIIDRITFEPPSGLLGLLLTKNRIADQLDDAYFHRNKTLAKLLEEGL
jgi:ligand-binding SRPBCC domain-containing protein